MSGRRYFQFLGTGAGDANFGTPEAAQVSPKDLRRYTCNYLAPSLLIDFNNHTPGAMDEYGIDPNAIEHLLISHGHFDHFQPLEIIRFAASLPHPLKVYGGNMVIDTLEFCRENVFDEGSGRFVAPSEVYNLELIRLDLGRTIAIEDVQVTTMLGNHSMNKPYNIMEHQALNFLIKVADKTIFYGLDSSYMIPKTLSQMNGTHLDIAILDATFGPRVIDPVVSGHHNWVMLDETLNDLRAAGCVDEHTILVAAHLSCGNIGLHDEVAKEQAARGITLAYDGLTLPL